VAGIVRPCLKHSFHHDVFSGRSTFQIDSIGYMRLQERIVLVTQPFCSAEGFAKPSDLRNVDAFTGFEITSNRISLQFSVRLDVDGQATTRLPNRVSTSAFFFPSRQLSQTDPAESTIDPQNYRTECMI